MPAQGALQRKINANKRQNDADATNNRRRSGPAVYPNESAQPNQMRPQKRSTNPEAMAELAQTIINSGKLELDYAKHTGQTVCPGFHPSASMTAKSQRKAKTPTGIKTI